jgi:inhibitor of KinA sporulation pathway (predicted exonuclease)
LATIINEPKEIELLDGTTISARPLKISLLKEFMKKFDEISQVADDNEKSIDVLLECVAIAMKQYAPETAGKDLEDILDLPTVYVIVEEASGIKLGESFTNLAA